MSQFSGERQMSNDPTDELPVRRRYRTRRFLIMLTAVLIMSGCNGSDPDPAGTIDGPSAGIIDTGVNGGSTGSPATAIQFADVTAGSGVDFTYHNGEEAGHFAILESLGGGVGAFDYDGDHDIDLLIPGGGHYPADRTLTGWPSALYRNNGGFQFDAVAAEANVTDSRFYSHGVAATDIDHDGFIDVLVTGYGGLRFFHNLGDGTFIEEAAARGLTDSSWSSSAAFGDFNHDGHPDVYVAHYVNWSFDNNPVCSASTPGQRDVCPPKDFTGLPDTLYLNQGDGTFADASAAWSLRRNHPDGNDGKGLGVVVGDVDVDGDLDVYVGNDTVANFLYRNTGTTFEDAGLMSGTSYSETGTPDGSMGVDLGDYNQDGRPDLWVANYESETFALYRNEGNCFFLPLSSSMGITAVGARYVGWGTAFMDADHDGDLDVFVSNGHVIRFPTVAPLRQLPLVFENQSGKRFVNVAESAGEYTSSPHMGRGMATADLDDDGDLDIVLSHLNEPVSLLENRSRTEHHWIGFRLIGRDSSRIPVGTRVTVKLSDGTELAGQLKSGSSYASTSDFRQYFGLGSDNRVTSARIVWPNGAVSELSNVESDRVQTLIEPAGHK